MKTLLVSVKGNWPNERKISVFIFFFPVNQRQQTEKRKKKTHTKIEKKEKTITLKIRQKVTVDELESVDENRTGKKEKIKTGFHFGE